VAPHEEEGEVPPGAPDVVDVLQPDAGLADDERVRRRGHLATSHPRLKVRDRGYRQEDIISPPSDYRIAIDHRVAALLEKPQERVLHLKQAIPLAYRRIANESILIARRIAARFPASVQGPKGTPARRAALALKALVLKEGDPIDVLQSSP